MFSNSEMVAKPIHIRNVRKKWVIHRNERRREEEEEKKLSEALQQWNEDRFAQWNEAGGSRI